MVYVGRKGALSRLCWRVWCQMCGEGMHTRALTASSASCLRPGILYSTVRVGKYWSRV
jgi:hypothetical protein